jgi:hypothetical protein
MTVGWSWISEIFEEARPPRSLASRKTTSADKTCAATYHAWQTAPFEIPHLFLVGNSRLLFCRLVGSKVDDSRHGRDTVGIHEKEQVIARRCETRIDRSRNRQL